MPVVQFSLHKKEGNPFRKNSARETWRSNVSSAECRCTTIIPVRNTSELHCSTQALQSPWGTWCLTVNPKEGHRFKWDFRLSFKKVDKNIPALSLKIVLEKCPSSPEQKRIFMPSKPNETFKLEISRFHKE